MSADVSVILINYNNADYIADAVRSVSAQTFKRWECIIVDDGSTDNSRSIIKKLTKRDSRFKVIFQQNKGGGAARNAGLCAATGEYIMFLDSDDAYTSPAMESMYETAVKHGADIVGGYAVKVRDDFHPVFEHQKTIIPQPFFIDTGSEYLWRSINDVSQDYKFVWVWRQMFRRDVLAEKFFPEDIWPNEDALFMLDILHNINKVALINIPVVYHRKSKTSASNAWLSQDIVTCHVELLKRARLVMDNYASEKTQNLVMKHLTKGMFVNMISKTMDAGKFRKVAAMEIKKIYRTPDFPRKYLNWRQRIIIWLFLMSFATGKME